MKKLVLKETKQLFKLTQLINEGVLDLDDLAALIPGILHVNSAHDLSLEYISKQGQDLIRYSMEELLELGTAVYERHQSDFTLKVTYPSLVEKISDGDTDKIIPFIQDWKHSEDDKPFHLFTSTRILNDDQLISVSIFPQNVESFSDKIDSIFGVDSLFDAYFERFNRLTKREKEVFFLLGKELSRKEIADILFISDKTVKNHAERVFQKLGTKKRTDLYKLAQVFSSLK
ncbi:LuxR C-terminal-related transcriptional regulator [Croceivirga radicis]|uniref:LuxR C-terminal-related transcriptional regulator n=1 Tax=Croceivirga radicis TaxID=1929488 RepID=UPI000255AEF4|nr:LuxR C-terminal-related transcriptional regulator [Croceivirga radicis]